MKVKYSSNNSGGGWWLSDEDWFALEAAGWEIHWVKDDPYKSGLVKDGRWLGALATEASREGLGFREAIKEWEDVTGESANELGCYSCCGAPHSFSSETAYYSPEAPTYGSNY